MIDKAVKGKIKYYKKPISRYIAPKTKKKRIRLNSKNLAIYVFPGILCGIGLYIIFSQIMPTAKFMLEQKFSSKYAEIASPVPVKASSNEEIQLGKFEAQYFSDLLANLQTTTSSNVAGVKSPYMNDWVGFFTISIPEVGIDQMRITANVNSHDESVYGEVLKKSLAHFAGTDLPANNDYEEDTNTFIYGHSAPSSWASLHKNSFEAAFNPLFDLEIGDKIYIDFLGEQLSYTVSKIKITKPDDLSTLNGIKGKKVLTLMTCAPPGSSTNRLNIIATLD